MGRVCFGLVLCCCLAATARAELVIEPDGIDASRFMDTGELVIAADVLDDNGTVVAGSLTKVEVFIDDQPVTGTFTVKSFREANNTLSLYAVLSAHQGYPAEAEPEQGLVVSPLAEEKKGFARLLASLGEQDRVATLYFNEEGIRPLSAWSSGLRATIASLDDLRSADERRGAPPLFEALSRAVHGFGDDHAHVTNRRVLVVMSDGQDPVYNNWLALEPLIDRLVDDANKARVEIVALGFTLAMPEPLVQLATLATRTGGAYREIAFEDHAHIADRLAALGTLFNERRMIRFTPTSWRGSNLPVRVRVEVETGDKQRFVRQLENIAIPLRPAPQASCGCASGGEGSFFGGMVLVALLALRTIRCRPCAR